MDLRMLIFTVVLLLSMAGGVMPQAVADEPGDEVEAVPGSISLGEVVVTAKVKPVVFRGDTVVINPAAFSLRDGAYVEELVRRVPGLSYDKTSGVLSYYGRSLNEVLVNGKKFFGQDTDVAVEDMAVEALSEVKIYEKTDGQSGAGGGGGVYVFDFTTNDELSSMTAANVEAAGGNKDRREISGRVSHHRTGGDKVKLKGLCGNKNMTSVYKDARIDRLSLDFSKRLNKFEVDGSVGYDGLTDGREDSEFAENYIATGNTYRYGSSDRENRSRLLDSRINVKGELSESTELNLSGSLKAGKTHDYSDSRSSTFSHDPQTDWKNRSRGTGFEDIPRDWRINDDVFSSAQRNRHMEYALDFLFRQRFNRGQTVLTVKGRTDVGRDRRRNSSLSEINYYQLQNMAGADSVARYGQYKYQPQNNVSANAEIGLLRHYRNLFAEIAYTYSIKRQRSRSDVYGLLPENEQKDYVDSLSSRTKGQTLTHGLRMRINYRLKAVEFNAVMAVMPQRQVIDKKIGSAVTDTVRHTTGLRPEFSAIWKSEQNMLEFNYKGLRSGPDMSSLLEVTDRSNPLFVSYGNTGLKPTYRQEAKISYHHSTGIFGDMEFSNSYNSIATAFNYNEVSGAYESYQTNVNGIWELHGHAGMFRNLGRGFTGTMDFSANRSQDVGMTGNGSDSGMSRSVTHSDMCNLKLNLNYHNKAGMLSASAKWNYMRSENRMTRGSDYLRSYEFNVLGNFDLPSNLFVNSGFRCLFRNGSYVSGDNRSEFVWNMSVGWRFLKQKMTLKVEWNDILNDEKPLTRIIRPSGFSETLTRKLGSYFLVSLGFKLSDMVFDYSVGN